MVQTVMVLTAPTVWTLMTQLDTSPVTDSHLQWPFKGDITVRLINQKEGGEHYKENLVESSDAEEDGYNEVFARCKEGDRSKKGLGLIQFLPHDDLYKPEGGKEYLKDDTLN